MADDPAVSRETEHARWMLEESKGALKDILEAFDLMRQHLLADGELSISDLYKARVALGHSRSQLLDEVNKYERQILLSEGLTAEAPIDFEAIKDQIGSRLDRIRKARDAGDFSEQSDEG